MRLTTLAVVLLTGCAESAVVTAQSELTVRPAALSFPDTPVGGFRDATLELLSLGRASHAAAVSVTGPFSVDAERVLVPGGGSVSLVVHFEPIAEGPAAGEVNIDGVTVPLSALGLAPVVCVANGPCDTVRVDPLSGACLHTAQPEGTSCNEACVSAGQCVAGACIGAAVDCDDRNACTDDACDPGTGCRHTETQCAAATNPCFAAVCSPSTGCGTAPVEDGTRCGAASCALAQVCMSGACIEAMPPDGAACTASPCQTGTCRAQQCVGGTPRVLSPAWSVVVPRDTVFRGVSDGAQALYWLECTWAQVSVDCAAVGHRTNGARLFRTALPSQRGGLHVPRGATQLYDSGHFVVAMRERLVSVNATTGAIEWTLPFTNTPFVDEGVDTADLAADRGTLWVLARLPPSPFLPFYPPTLLLRVELATGVLLGESPNGDRNGLVVRQGVAYVGSTSGRVSAFESTGTLRFEVQHTQPVTPIAANSLLLADGNRLLDPANAVVLFQLPSIVSTRDDAVMLDDSVFRIEDGSLKRYEPSVTAAAVLGSVGTQPTALFAGTSSSAGSVVMSVGHRGAQATLTGMSAQRAGQFDCPLGPPYNPLEVSEVIDHSVAFTGSHLALRVWRECHTCDADGSGSIEVYTLPTLSPAASGWTMERGGPRQAGRSE